MSDKHQILIVDDQKLMRQGLRILLELEPDMQVIAEAENGKQGVELYAELKPDVVLMDINMPELDGVSATSQIMAADPQARIIILTTFDGDSHVFDGIRAGARGYMLKDMSGDELAQAIRTVMSGGSLLDPSVIGKVMAAVANMPSAAATTTSLAEPLSEREVEILKLVAEGMSNGEIGRKLHLAEGTVKNYVSNILQKTNTRDRTQAVVTAQQAGLL